MRWLVLVACACSSKPASKPPDDAAIAQHQSDAAAPVIDAMNPHWGRAYDFDGDQLPDTITTTYSGGGHCCYKVSVELSASHRVVDVPFELDGGYIGGLDLSRPDNFGVEVAGGVAVLHMRIAKYGTHDEPIPLEWVHAFGLRSHSIRVGFRGGVMHVENETWSCAVAMQQLMKFQLASWEGLPECGPIDIPDGARNGLDRELGTERRMVTTRSVLDIEHERALTFSIDTNVERVDFDAKLEVKDALDVFGVPEARLPYTLWGFTHSTGQWVWPARGIALYVDPSNATIHHVAVFAPTDLAGYKHDIEAQIVTR